MARLGNRNRKVYRNSEDFIKIQDELPRIIKKANIPITALINAGINPGTHYSKLKSKTYSTEDIVKYMDLIVSISTSETLQKKMPEIIQMAAIPVADLLKEIGITTKKYYNRLSGRVNFSGENIIHCMQAIITIKNRELHKYKQKQLMNN